MAKEGRACPECGGDLDAGCAHVGTRSASQIAWETAREFESHLRAGAGRPAKGAESSALRREDVLARTPGLSGSLFDEALFLHKRLDPEDARREELAAGTLAIGSTYDLERRAAKRAEILANPVAPPDGKYDIVVADPPWQYDEDERRGAAERHYRTMAIDELIAMRTMIDDIATSNSMLLLWATVPLLPCAIRLMEAWGFEYRTEAVWHKTGAIGMGSIVRIDHEPLLVGRRGSGISVAAHDVRSIIPAARGAHSQKPNAVYDAIDRLWPAHRKIDLFARRTREGWATWGAEAPTLVAR